MVDGDRGRVPIAAGAVVGPRHLSQITDVEGREVSTADDDEELLGPGQGLGDGPLARGGSEQGRGRRRRGRSDLAMCSANGDKTSVLGPTDDLPR